jgi:hypothetical protein
MVFEIFSGLVAGLALAYAAATRYIQAKMIDKSGMESMQAQSKRLNEEFKKAEKANDKKRMERIMDEQVECLKQMNGVMLGQFKPLIVIMLLFGACTWAIGAMDPTAKDDMKLNLTDDGAGCDNAAGDGVFTGCFNISGANAGKWTVSARALEGNTDAGDNQTYFIYGPGSDNDTYVEQGKGTPIELATDKREYYPGETVVITAEPATEMPPASLLFLQISPARNVTIGRVEATVSNGTYFKVDLPLTIPLLNVKSIYQPYWWFFLLYLLAAQGIGFVMGKAKKAGQTKGEAGKGGNGAAK